MPILYMKSGKNGVYHKMGHYTGEKLTPIANTCNNSAYFQNLKFHHKVGDVMIKPRILYK
jgi:molybdopterin synthase catalytic subunit